MEIKSWSEFLGKREATYSPCCQKEKDKRRKKVEACLERFKGGCTFKVDSHHKCQICKNITCMGSWTWNGDIENFVFSCDDCLTTSCKDCGSELEDNGRCYERCDDDLPF